MPANFVQRGGVNGPWLNTDAVFMAQVQADDLAQWRVVFTTDGTKWIQDPAVFASQAAAQTALNNFIAGLVGAP
jgi:hypothetical protein